MAILIRGMQMPDNCEDCPCGYETEGVYRDECQVLSREWEKDATSNRPDWCPLVEVPKGARLIDAKELKNKVSKWLPPDLCVIEEKEYPFETDICVSMLMEIDNAPIIFEEDDE